MDAARFVFLDETGLTTKMTRLYGRSRRGERLVGAVPHGHWRTTTFIAGLRQSAIIAPMVLDGPMTGAAFRAYVEQALTPALQPGDVVVMDNLPLTKWLALRRRSRWPAPTCSTCRPTAPISTRSSSSLPSSKRYCARRPRAPKRLYGKPPASSSTWFRPSSAGVISPMPDTIPPNAKML